MISIKNVSKSYDKKEKFIEDFNDKKVKLEEIKILSKQYW